MFVDKLDIKEFRGIKSCVKPIAFSNFSVLIGRNNSGKSTILEALSLLPCPRIHDFIHGFSKIQYLTNLHQSQKRLLYLYAGSAKLEYHLKRNIINVNIYENYYETILDNIKNPIDELISQTLDIKIDQLSQSVFFIPYTTSIIDALEDKMRILKELIMKKGVHIELAKFLNQCVNDEYSEIVFLEPISLRKIYQNNNVYIQLKDLGSGAEKVIKIMALLEVMTPKLVLIDDFEAGLHPSLLMLFLKWLKEKNGRL